MSESVIVKNPYCAGCTNAQNSGTALVISAKLNRTKKQTHALLHARFYPHDAMLARYVLCLSLGLSAGVLSKRRHRSS